MDFIKAEELYKATEGLASSSLVIEIMRANHIVTPSPVVPFLKGGLEQQALEYVKDKSWDPDNITVFYHDSTTRGDVYKCVFAMGKWNDIKNIICKTLKMKAFL